MNELRDQLWDFVYGLLDEADAAKLRERITSDRQVAREYARVKLQSELLAQAARANLAERELPLLPERLGTAAAGRLSGVRLAVFSGSLALSLTLLLLVGVTYWEDGTALRGPAVAQALEDFEQKKHPRLIVTGPQVLEPKAANTFEVTVQRLDGGSLSAPVAASLEDFDGNSLWYESLPTDVEGKRSVELPADKLRGEGVRLKIQVETDAAEEDVDNGAALETWLPIQKQHGDLSVINRVTDGQHVYFREAEIQALDRAVFSDSVDKLSESSRSENLRPFKESQSNDDPSLTEEAKGVRWGTEKLAQLSRQSKLSDLPADNATDEKSKSGDWVKQFRESPAKTEPAIALPPLARPGADSRENPSFNSPASPPRNARPLPGTSAEIVARGKKEMPRQPEAAVDAPVSAPAPTANPPEPANSFVAEADATDPATLNKWRENGRQVLLEGITANEKLIASRMVDGSEAPAELQQRIDDLRKERKIDDTFSGRIEMALYDPAVAPPQKVAGSSIEILPTIEPLNCTIRFDRVEYREGDLVAAELQVTGADSQPLPAVLNVQVDAIALAEADAEQLPAPASYLFIKAEPPQVPMVFDNAVQQAHSYQQSIARRLARQHEAQRHTALILLTGSGIGFALLIAARLLKWLPRIRHWLPVAMLLGFCALSGVMWLLHKQLPHSMSVVSPASPLTTYGVQSAPPMTDKAGSGQPSSTPEELESLPDRTEDELLTVKESRLPETVTAQIDNGTIHRLFAMSDWERLAVGAEQRSAANAKLFSGDFSLSYFADDRQAIPLALPEQQDSAGNIGKSASAQTIYWHPRLTTDSRGRCRVQFQAPSGPRAHRLTVIAHGTGRLGTASEVIPTVLLLPNQ